MAPNGHSDDDGFCDLDEYLAGTDPTNGNSCLEFEEIVRTPGASATGVVVRWSSVAGKFYRLDRSTNLATDPLSVNVKSNIPAIPPANTETDNTAVGQGPRFYRIKLER